MSLKDKYCIVGAATTKFGRVPGVSPLQFTVEAARLAIEDAGLEKGDVDAVLCKYPRPVSRACGRTKCRKPSGSSR